MYDVRKKAKHRAMYILERREHSKKELFDKLLKSYEKEVALDITDEMESLGLVDDRRFAEIFIRELSQVRGYGVLRVRNELFKKGISADIINELLGEVEKDEEVDRAVNTINRKYFRYINDDKGIQKVIAAMLRQGFEFSVIKTALEEVIDVD